MSMQYHALARAGHDTLNDFKTHAWAPRHACCLLSDAGMGAMPNTLVCRIKW